MKEGGREGLRAGRGGGGSRVGGEEVEFKTGDDLRGTRKGGRSQT